ncbi:MAG: universal stress protein [Pseudomonadota bacterium]
MFKRILYPTDFSDVAGKAMDYIKGLEGCKPEEVIILHVINERNIEALRIYAAGKINFEDFIKEMIDDATRLLDWIESELKVCGYHVKKRVEVGNPLQEILKIEEEENISIIILGSHGKTNLTEMFLGSVSEKVIRKSKGPVLVVKR